MSTRFGDTIVLCTACAHSNYCEDAESLPLRVDFAEKFSAAGRTSASYMKREGKPSEREILASRLVDRALRLMFEKDYFHEVQVLATAFSCDRVHQAEAIAICGASVALHISSIPLAAPSGSVRVGWDGHKWNVEPEPETCAGELVVAGCENGILMIDG